MTDQYNRSPIAKRIDRILRDKELFSDDSSNDQSNHNSPLKPRQQQYLPYQLERENSRKLQQQQQSTELDDTPPARETKHPPQKKRSKSNPKQRPKTKSDLPKSTLNNTTMVNKSFRTKSPLHMQQNETISCFKEKVELRSKIVALERQLGQQKKRIKDLKTNIQEDKNFIEQLKNRLEIINEKEDIIEKMRQKEQLQQVKEKNLHKEIQEQQKIVKDTLNRLALSKQEQEREIERLKDYYKEFYRKENEESIRQYDAIIKKYESEKDKLYQEFKLQENERDMLKAKESAQLNNEIIYLNNQLQQRNLETERYKAEIKELKHIIRDHEKNSNVEITGLKNQMEGLTEENRMLKINEEEMTRRELQEKLSLKRKIDDLEINLQQKANELKEKDYSFKMHQEKVNEKVVNLQQEFQKMHELEKRNEELQRRLQTREDEILQLKRYYKDKLHKRKTIAEDQKHEWSNIYNDLLCEIRELKNDIENLSFDNKKMSSLLGSKGSVGNRERYQNSFLQNFT